MGLETLVKISNYYGSNKDYVLAGGGNTSYKDENFLYIKGSGTTLATITESGFVKMNRKKLSEMWGKQYSNDTAEREAQVLNDLMNARENDDKRPSVETSLHDLFSQSYVVHTHPSLVNGLTCSKDGEKAAKELFGEDIIWIPPTMPGYVLASEVKAKIDSYESQGKTANMIFLANHGIFVAGNTEEEIEKLMTDVFDKLKARIKRFPDFTYLEKNTDSLEENLKEVLNANSVKFECSREILNFVSDSNEFKKVYSAFTPDHMVYYKHKAMYLENGQDMQNTVSDFVKIYGFKPKIVAVQNIGVFACDENDKSAATAAELFNDTVKIAVFAENFGGGTFMPDWLIDFIANWEVESYRKSKADK